MTNDLATLIGSRACYDLISPIGAISNGVELMALTGGGGSQEMALTSDSAQNASARIRFFRVAFGAASAGQGIARREVLSVLSDIAQKGRISYQWEAEDDGSRTDVRSCFLILMCFETAKIHGGGLTVRRDGAGSTLTSLADRFLLDYSLCQRLNGIGQRIKTSPAHMQFALLPRVLRKAESTLCTAQTHTTLTVSFGPD
jgi:histidine phosphotransferase ChpT